MKRGVAYTGAKLQPGTLIDYAGYLFEVEHDIHAPKDMAFFLIVDEHLRVKDWTYVGCKDIGIA